MRILTLLTLNLLLILIAVEIHKINIKEGILERRLIRDTSNPFNLPEPRFIRTYRLPPSFAWNMIQGLSPFVRQRTHPYAIPLELRALATLRFLCTGDYQRSIGDLRLHSMGRSTVGNFIHEIVEAINLAYLRDWVTFPAGNRDADTVQLGFLNACNLNNIGGAIDGFHILFYALSYSYLHEPAFVNRHQSHSLNALIVADQNYRILFIDPRYPGSNHDGHNFRVCRLRRYLQHCYRNGIDNIHLIGDSAFPLEPYMFRPYENPMPGSDEAEFNRRLAKGRAIVEQTIGLLRSWIRCLNDDRKLHYQPHVVCNMVYAGAVLHNMLVHTRVNTIFTSADEEADDEDDGEDDSSSSSSDSSSGNSCSSIENHHLSYMSASESSNEEYNESNAEYESDGSEIVFHPLIDNAAEVNLSHSSSEDNSTSSDSDSDIESSTDVSEIREAVRANGNLTDADWLKLGIYHRNNYLENLRKYMCKKR